MPYDPVLPNFQMDDYTSTDDRPANQHYPNAGAAEPLLFGQPYDGYGGQYMSETDSSVDYNQPMPRSVPPTSNTYMPLADLGLQNYAAPREGYAPMDQTPIEDTIPPANARYKREIGWYLPVPTSMIDDNTDAEFIPEVGWFMRVHGPRPSVASAYALSIGSVDSGNSAVYSGNPGPTFNDYNAQPFSDTAPTVRRTTQQNAPPRSRSSRVEKSRAQPRQPSKPAGTALSGRNLQLVSFSIVQTCSCQSARDAKESHVKRPTNPYLLYRSEMSRRSRPKKGEKKGKQNPDISKMTGKAWNTMTEEQKLPWKQRFAAAEADFKERNPDYKYDPAAMVIARFGFHDCSCGARQANMESLKEQGTPRRLENIRKKFAQDMYDVPTPGPNFDQFQAPTAPMYPAGAYASGTGNYGIDLNDIEAWNNQQEQRRRSSAQNYRGAANPNAGTEPLRRSTRQANRHVHYAENEDDESLFLPRDDGDVTPTQANQTTRHRPASIPTQSINETIAGIQDWMQAGAGGQHDMDMEEDANAEQDPDFDDLFGEAFNAADSRRSSEIVVASNRRRSSTMPRPSPKLFDGLALSSRPQGQNAATRSQGRSKSGSTSRSRSLRNNRRY